MAGLSALFMTSPFAGFAGYDSLKQMVELNSVQAAVIAVHHFGLIRVPLPTAMVPFPLGEIADGAILAAASDIGYNTMYKGVGTVNGESVTRQMKIGAATAGIYMGGQLAAGMIISMMPATFG